MGAFRHQKRVLDLLQLELQVIVTQSLNVDSGNLKEQQELLISELSLSPFYNLQTSFLNSHSGEQWENKDPLRNAWGSGLAFSILRWDSNLLATADSLSIFLAADSTI